MRFMSSESRPFPNPQITSSLGIRRAPIGTVSIEIDNRYYDKKAWFKEFFITKKGLERDYSQIASTAFQKGDLISAVIFARKTLDIPDESKTFKNELGFMQFEVLEALNLKTFGYKEFYDSSQKAIKEFQISEDTSNKMTKIIDQSQVSISNTEWIAAINEFKEKNNLWEAGIASQELAKLLLSQENVRDAKQAYLEAAKLLKQAEAFDFDEPMKTEITRKEIRTQRREVLESLGRIYETKEPTNDDINNLIYILVEGAQIGLEGSLLINLGNGIIKLSKPLSKEKRLVRKIVSSIQSFYKTMDVDKFSSPNKQYSAYRSGKRNHDELVESLLRLRTHYMHLF